MRFEDVLPLARDEGKKIRRKSWPMGDRVCFSHDGPANCFFRGGSGVHAFNRRDLLAEDWEVVEENPHEKGTNPWAAWELERGKVLTFGGVNAKYRAKEGSSCGWVQCFGRDDDRWVGCNLTLAMLAATDWRHAEEEA